MTLAHLLSNRPWALIAAWLATGAATIAAFWPWLSNGVTSYDPIVALTTLTVIGLTWYTYFTRESLEHARTQARQSALSAEANLRRYRESLATAVLAELHTLLPRLRKMSEDRAAGAADPDYIDHPMLSAASSKPELFDKETIRAVTVALTYLRDLQGQLTLIPVAIQTVGRSTSPQDQGRSRERLDNLIAAAEIRSIWAHNRLAPVVEQLVLEGGLVPPDDTEPEIPITTRPALLPDPLRVAR